MTMAIKKVSDLNYYELLNVPVGASDETVHQAYLQNISIYSESSVASYRAISDDERRRMLARLNQAYDTLKSASKREKYDRETLGLTEEDRRRAGHDAPAAEEPEYDAAQWRGRPTVPWKGEKKQDVAPKLDSRRITGANLRDIREAMGASLDQIAEMTKIKKSYLEAIELEKADSFPAPVFMKGFLKAYARALGLNPNEVTEKYLAG